MGEKINNIEAMDGFYKTFQIGIEIEGSFLKDENETNEIIPSGIELVSDGSIDCVDDGGYIYELRTDIITSDARQKSFIEGLEAISEDHQGEKIFAYRNKTAGTHVHFDFREAYARENNLNAHCLIAFDSLDFERYFFKEYFKRFSKSKFSDRLRNTYCKPFISDVRSTDGSRALLRDVEDRKGSRDRYYWLNTVSIFDGKGLELRIFPYLQTASGVNEVIDFTKCLLMKYWAKPKVKRRAQLVKKYFEKIGDASINTKKLNEYEKILMSALNISGRPKMRQSSDSIEFLMELYNKKPSAFENTSGAF